MFRPNIGIDLNDFPALGTPPPSNGRTAVGTVAATASLPPPPPPSFLSATSNRFANYPPPQSSLHDSLLSAGHLGDFHTSSSSSMAAQYDFQTTTSRGLEQPRSFSTDEFPALQRSAAAHHEFQSRSTESSATAPSLPPPPQGDTWDYTRELIRNDNKAFNGLAGALKTDGAQWASSLPASRGNGPIGTPAGSLAPISKKAVGSGVTSTSLINNNSTSGGKDAIDKGEGQDSYGLLGLLGVIRMTDPDRSMLALGSDLTTLGLDLNTADSIYSTFISPWSDTQTPPGLNVEPGYYTPSCYRTVRAKPAAHQRMRTFPEEILFYVFYSMPKDVAQEAAAQELYVRGWRYHKELGMWLSKEADENGRPVQGFRRTSPNPVDRGVYVIFDPTSWSKVKREWTLAWDALEERPQQQQHPTPSLSSSTASSSHLSLSQQQQQQQQQQMGSNASSSGLGMSGRGVMI